MLYLRILASKIFYLVNFLRTKRTSLLSKIHSLSKFYVAKSKCMVKIRSTHSSKRKLIPKRANWRMQKFSRKTILWAHREQLYVHNHHMDYSWYTWYQYFPLDNGLRQNVHFEKVLRRPRPFPSKNITLCLFFYLLDCN